MFRSEDKVNLARPVRIPTPLPVRWRRVRYQLIPIVTVALCSLAAWRLWRESPHLTAIGQVTTETDDLRTPSAGMVAELPDGKVPRLFDEVSAGQVLARIQQDNGQWTDLTATLAGQIIAIHREPGQKVGPGESILTLAPSRDRHIAAYVRADHPIQIEPGMPVTIHPQSDPAASFRAAVERIGPRYERIPAAQLRDRKAEEWGLPILLSVPPECALKPGEFVYVEWR